MITPEKQVQIGDYAVTIARLTREQRQQIVSQVVAGLEGKATAEAFRLGVMRIEGMSAKAASGQEQDKRPDVFGVRGGWNEAQLDSWADQLGDLYFIIIANSVLHENQVSGVRAKNSAAPSDS